MLTKFFQNKTIKTAIFSTTLILFMGHPYLIYKTYAQNKNDQKDFSSVLVDYQKSQRLRLCVGRGDVYKEQKEWNLALAYYNKVIQIDPNFIDAYISRGLLYKDQKRWDLAIADYNQAIQINPNLSRTYLGRGLLYKDQKKWDLAIADYSKAIQIEPNLAEAYLGRGIVYWDKLDKRKALADLQQAGRLFQAKGNNFGYGVVLGLLKQLQEVEIKQSESDFTKNLGKYASGERSKEKEVFSCK